MAERPKNRGGRPRLPGTVRYIRMRSSVFELWRQRKADLGFNRKTDSLFAEYLLHRATDRVTTEDEEIIPGPLLPRYFSTPNKKERKLLQLQEPSPSNADMDVDVTGSMSKLLLDANPRFNSVKGNPFSVLKDIDKEVEGDTESDTDSEGDVDDVEIEDSDVEDKISEMMSSILDVICVDSDDNDDDDESYATDEDIGLFRQDVDIALDDCLETEEALLVGNDELTLTVIEDEKLDQIIESEDLLSVDNVTNKENEENENEEQLPTNNATSGLRERQEERVENVNNTVEPNKETVLQDLEKHFVDLTEVKGLQDLVDLHSRLRLIVSVEKLIELAGKTCTFTVNGVLCGLTREYSSHPHSSCIEIRWHCSNRHFGKWESSEVLTRKGNSNIFLNDCLLAIAIAISGNNYAKFLLLCKALNLKIIGSTSFGNFQKHCVLPVVQDVWDSMKKIIKEILGKYKDLCVAGDGRNDSPGHSARYCVYTIMEHFTKVIIDLEVVDKRETGGNSTAMEKEALRRLIERLIMEFNLGELVTDASTTVIKLIRDLKDVHAQLIEFFHSLDIWHKSKKLSKCLHQAARVKGCEDLKEWIEPIINHFWYCCQVADGSAEKLKDLWQGVLHHVCGEHSWVESECSHGTHVETESSKKPLAKNSKSMAGLRKIVLDDKWMKSLHFYVRFRHTGELENFNSMMTKYAPKRSAFEYPYFIMRILLAAIDHNLHLFRKPKRGKDGEILLHRKFSKRTKRYHAEVVKEEKEYKYFPYLVARMLDARKVFDGSFTQKRSSEGFDPKQIAPTIGMIAPLPTAELRRAPTRFDMKKKT